MKVRRWEKSLRTLHKQPKARRIAMEQRSVLTGRKFTVAKQSDDREVGVDLVDHADIVIGHAV